MQIFPKLYFYYYSINQYYDAIAEVIGYEGTFSHNLSKPIGMKQKLVDISKQKAFGWNPKNNLQEGVKITYDFFLKTIIYD